MEGPPEGDKLLASIFTGVSVMLGIAARFWSRSQQHMLQAQKAVMDERSTITGEWKEMNENNQERIKDLTDRIDIVEQQHIECERKNLELSQKVEELEKMINEKR